MTLVGAIDGSFKNPPASVFVWGVSGTRQCGTCWAVFGGAGSLNGTPNQRNTRKETKRKKLTSTENNPCGSGDSLLWFLFLEGEWLRYIKRCERTKNG
ncbi:hypothetical protein I7I53_06037 [Histoplasma capsulatum var. duboisii H88]|uniref:Uncharacterized protein n=1 Tax=Ajellomyces capsulatus (strain H88) TaxID=544711 RepID=A0A8A1LGG9_AJEC8|nr:hypothetical protein I7I53_06037 [Histoplasma capsulatum var. duboisii H88]